MDNRVDRGLTTRIAVTVLLIGAAGLFGLGALIATSPPSRSDPLPAKSVAAVVALSGWVRADSQLNRAGRERLLSAMPLVRAGYAPRLITTRVQRGDRGPVSDTGQARLVRRFGLERQWTVVDGIQWSTRDEAMALRKTLPESTAIIVVTSPSHTGRACATFERVGFRVTCVASSARTSKWLSLRETLYERLATIKYRRDGFIR
jgi:uncharacterized SAM-binding protein YcdF (DUF218 family)